MEIERREFLAASGATAIAVSSGCVSLTGGDVPLSVDAVQTDDIVTGDISTDGKRIYAGTLNSEIYCYKINENAEEFNWMSNFGNIRNTSNVEDVEVEKMELEWKVKLDEGSLYTHMLVDENNLYVPFSQGALCLNKYNGELKWKAKEELYGKVIDACIDPEGNFYLTGPTSFDERFRQQGNFSTDMFYTPGYIHKLDNKGNVDWVRSFEDATLPASRPIYYKGYIYTSTTGIPQYLKLDAETGTNEWKKELPEGACDTSACIDKEREVLYFGCMNNDVYCVQIEDGETVWKTSTQNTILSAPVLTKNDNLIIGSYDNNIYNINPESGKINWKTDIGDQVYISPASRGGNLFVLGLNEGKINILEEKTGELKAKTESITYLGHGSPIAFSESIIVPAGTAPEIYNIDYND